MGYPHYEEQFTSYIIFSVTAPTKTENAPIILYIIRYFAFLVKTYNEICEKLNSIGYPLRKVTLNPSGRPEFGEYQINDAMNLGKELKKNPRDIAQEIINELEKDNRFVNLNIAGPGFINLSLSNEFYINAINEMLNNIESNIDKMEPKKIFIDYGGANIAKTLHVGHLRSANIGEAIKRLTKLLAYICPAI